MIRGKTVSHLEPIEELEGYAGSMYDIAQDIGDDIIDDVVPELEARLKAEPRTRTYPADYPLEWTSDKQRRYVMWLLRTTNRFPYVSTHELSNAWDVWGTMDKGEMVITIKNPSHAAEFVYGTLSFRGVNEAKRTQQRFHQITGWQTAVETANFFFDEAEERYVTALDDAIGEFAKKGKRRRSRRSRRRKNARNRTKG